MVYKWVYAFLLSAIFSIFYTNIAFCDGMITTIPQNADVELKSSSNSAILSLSITPIVNHSGNHLYIALSVAKSVSITSGGMIGGLLRTTAEMEASNPIDKLVLEGPGGYREIVEDAWAGNFSLPDGRGRANGQFRLIVKTKFFDQKYDVIFNMTVPLKTADIRIRFIDNWGKDLPFIQVGSHTFRIEVRFREARDDDEIDVDLRNNNTYENEDIECLRREQGKVYLSGLIRDVISEDLKAVAGHTLEARFEDIVKRIPVSLREVKVLQKGTRLIVDNATLSEIGQAPVPYSRSNHYFILTNAPAPTLAAGSHRMRIEGQDYTNLEFTMSISREGAITTSAHMTQNFEIEGSTLKAYLESVTGIYVKFRFYNRLTHKYEPIPQGIKVCLMNYDITSGDNEIKAFTINNSEGKLVVPNKIWEDGDDLYFKVDMEHEKPDVQVQYGGLEYDVEWSTKENQAQNGYFDNFAGNYIGLPSAPIVYTIEEKDRDNDNWTNDACFIIKTIKEVYKWYSGMINESWEGVPELDAEIGVLAESWAPPTSNTIALNDKRNHQWSRATICHEYSHQVMYNLSKNITLFDAAYAFLMGEIPDHYYTKESHPDTALLEGWAEFIEWAFTNAPPWDKNSFWRGKDKDPTNNSGEIVEGAVANAFYEINKRVIKSDKNLFMKIFWNTLKTNPEDVKEFQDYVFGLTSLNHDVKQMIKDILHENGIVYSRLKLVRYVKGNNEPEDFDATWVDISRTDGIQLVARPMTATELMTSTIHRDVKDVDEIKRAHFEVLTKPLKSANDTSIVNSEVFNKNAWREFAVVNKNSKGNFETYFNPSKLGLAPGVYAVRARAETSFGTLDNFYPHMSGGGSPVNTGQWHKKQGVFRALRVRP